MSINRVIFPCALAVAASGLAACGSRGPSQDEANAALKELPQMQFLMGAAASDPKVHLVSDLKCDKTGDDQFKCQVLLPKNPINGLQQTVPVEFVKLGGKWHANAE